MPNLVSGPIGSIHLAFSVLSLVTGIMVLAMHKGDLRHKRMGYVYSVSMLLVNVTAFMLYNLYGKFGVFHVFAIVSLITLGAGLYPIWRKSGTNYIYQHFNFMYWSVIGLYCAFMAEIFSRLPKYVLTPEGKPMTVFYQFVGVGTAVVMIIGVIFFAKYKKVWKNQFKLQ